MLGVDEYGDDTGTVFRDVITLALGGFCAAVFLLVPHIHPKAELNKATVDAPGTAIVELRWPDEIDADIDLWVSAPDETPVGYTNKGGRTFNLLRDDRGHYADPARLNYEVSYSRGLPAGEYVVNLHYYGAGTGGSVPTVPTVVVVSTRSPSTGVTTRLFTENIELTHFGEEVTAFRFRVDEKGAVVPGSLNHLYKPLREGEKR